MINFTRTLLLTATTCTLFFAACEKKEAEQPKETIEEKVDMSMVGESKFGKPVQFTDPDEVPSEKLGNVDVGGSTLSISIVGKKEPNAKLTVNIDHVSGPVPGTIRLWIGSHSGEGSVKSKAGQPRRPLARRCHVPRCHDEPYGVVDRGRRRERQARLHRHADPLIHNTTAMDLCTTSTHGESTHGSMDTSTPERGCTAHDR